MTEKTSQSCPKDICFSHLLALKYALAGDMESAEPLDSLLKRWHAIQWDNADFLSLSERMRHSLPRLTVEQQMSEPSSWEAVNILSESLAASNESLVNAMALVAQANKQLEALTPLLGKIHARLQFLGDDMSAFQLPQ